MLPIRSAASWCLRVLPLLVATVASHATLPPGAPAVQVGGTLRVNHRVTLDVLGPATDEAGEPNPFLDVRFEVVFIHQDSATQFTVPGYFAADGQAGETGATAGDVWRCHLTPAFPGTWSWRTTLRGGPGVAIDAAPGAGDSLIGHGLTGSFQVLPLGPPTGSRLRDEGRLRIADDHHLHHELTDRAWLAMGPNSPENLLAYVEFDQTPDGEHGYLPHVADWQPGDPTWHAGALGKGLIGAANYLASLGMNTMSMLVFNVAGDGDDVWPWAAKHDRLRFDCSKLDQWEVFFEHLDDLGISPHLLLGEQEIDDVNDGPLALDSGTLGTERKLFHRELLARFGHHLGLVINLGEENQNKTPYQIEFYDHLNSLDPWDHPIVVHTFPTTIPVVYPPLIEASVLQGASLQVLDPFDAHATSLELRGWADAAELPWIVDIHEIGPPNVGLLPDAADYWHDAPRQQVLWGNLMAGGGGCQWYFGYAWPNDDLDCEDFRSREHMFQLSAFAKEFFEQHLPFADMEPADDLVVSGQAWCLADPGFRYAAYLPAGGTVKLQLAEQPSLWRVRWFDPRNGGDLIQGDTVMLHPGMPLSLEAPASAPTADWAAVIDKVGVAPGVTLVGTVPESFEGGDLAFSIEVDDPDNDVVAVDLHVFDLGGKWLGSAPAVLGADGDWLLLLSDLPSPPSGLWPVLVIATDASGLVGTEVTLVPVP